jgi:hypothetical protein
MAKQIILPADAFDDVRTLVGLSRDQLTSLDAVFATAASASPLRTTFINRVAETLRITIQEARSVVIVTHFLLLRPGGQEGQQFVSELLDDFREFLADSATEDESGRLLAAFDEKRELFASLATPKQERLRAQKILRLARGPERTVESVRTVCQLRPMYEGPEHEEEIIGLVPVTLLELKTKDVDGMVETHAFGLDTEALAALERVIERTKEKLGAMRQKYGSELLTTD